MKLAIDIGNTSTRLALFVGKDVFATSNINECILKNIQDFVANKEISATIISSVKKINPEILSILDYYRGVLLSKDLSIPINNHYKSISHLIYLIITFDVATNISSFNS